jgi:hypothetical protein
LLKRVGWRELRRMRNDRQRRRLLRTTASQ